MIREERDPKWWMALGAHPSVAPTLYGLSPAGLATVALRDDVVPLASEHGGLLFARMDALGLVFDLHAAFTPEGWGREAYATLYEALTLMFNKGCQLVFVSQTDNPNSRPPRSFGFQQCGGETDTDSVLGVVTGWFLSRAAWVASPAFKRGARCLH